MPASKPKNQSHAARREYPGLVSARWARQSLLGVYLSALVVYLTWRVGFTLPWAEPALLPYALVFLGAELLLGWLSVTFFVHLNGGARREPPPEALRGASVDVLIPTYNEDVALIRRTAVAARDMDFPCNVRICDDGRRPEMRALAGELGVGYRVRPDNTHFKAGNLNAALKNAEAEFLLILDADHVPRRALLTRTIGYFRDPNVAFVQIPQVYYNLDSFQHAPDFKRGRLYHENSLFQHDIQSGSERYNAAFFVGTAAVFRRSALEAIGGIATASITEDILTALRLHDRGYKSVFVDEPLAFLIGPETPLAFVQQRLRWAQGAMQILRLENPLLKKGLTPWQRIAYFNALAGWLAGPATLVMWIAPAVYLLTGVSPLVAPIEVALPVIAAKVAVDLSVYLLLCYPQGRLLLSDAFRMMVAPLASFAALTLLKPDGLQFKVTPKGRQAGLPKATLVPLIALTALNLAAIGAGLSAGLGAGVMMWLKGILIAFCLYFSAAMLYAILFALERQQADGENPLPVDLPAALSGPPARVALMNLTVAWLRTGGPATLEAAVTFEVPCPDGDVLPMRGAVQRVDRCGGEWVAKVALEPIDPDDADRLDEFLFEVALPAFLASFRAGPRVHDAPEALPAGATTAAAYLNLSQGLV